MDNFSPVSVIVRKLTPADTRFNHTTYSERFTIVPRKQKRSESLNYESTNVERI